MTMNEPILRFAAVAEDQGSAHRLWRASVRASDAQRFCWLAGAALLGTCIPGAHVRPARQCEGHRGVALSHHPADRPHRRLWLGSCRYDAAQIFGEAILGSAQPIHARENNGRESCYVGSFAGREKTMPVANPNSPLSAHGSHLVDDAFWVYRQGGLDTYCGFYAILNLVNFLKFNEAGEPDFIGSSNLTGKPFGHFQEIVATREWQEAFRDKPPLGDEGLDTRRDDGDIKQDLPFVAVLRAALARAGLKFRPQLADDLKADPRGERKDRWFRRGAEQPFELPQDVLGIGAVFEDENDTLGHWIVLVGKAHLEKRKLGCEGDWDGIVLDLERGYERWRLLDTEEGPRLALRRAKGSPAQPMLWVYSFVGVSK